MTIYGTALLAVCHLIGIITGDLFGRALGMETNVGGVGIAMLLLIIARIYLHKAGLLCATSESGVHYWGSIYIPVVWRWQCSKTWSQRCVVVRRH